MDLLKIVQQGTITTKGKLGLNLLVINEREGVKINGGWKGCIFFIIFFLSFSIFPFIYISYMYLKAKHSDMIGDTLQI